MELLTQERMQMKVWGWDLTSLLLWVSIVLGPLAFFLDQQLGYLLQYNACSTGRPWILHLVSLGALLLAVGGAVLGWSLYKKFGAEPQEIHARRGKFMAICGTALGISGTMLVIAMAIPRFVLSPCE